MKFDKLKPGMTVYDVGRHRVGAEVAKLSSDDAATILALLGSHE